MANYDMMRQRPSLQHIWARRRKQRHTQPASATSALSITITIVELLLLDHSITQTAGQKLKLELQLASGESPSTTCMHTSWSDAHGARTALLYCHKNVAASTGPPAGTECAGQPRCRPRYTRASPHHLRGPCTHGEPSTRHRAGTLAAPPPPLPPVPHPRRAAAGGVLLGTVPQWWAVLWQIRHACTPPFPTPAPSA